MSLRLRKNEMSTKTSPTKLPKKKNAKNAKGRKKKRTSKKSVGNAKAQATDKTGDALSGAETDTPVTDDALGPAALLLILIFVQLSVLILGVWLLVRLGAHVELVALVAAFIAEHYLDEKFKKDPTTLKTLAITVLNLAPASIVTGAFFARGRPTVGFFVLAAIPALYGLRWFVRWRVKLATA